MLKKQTMPLQCLTYFYIVVKYYLIGPDREAFPYVQK